MSRSKPYIRLASLVLFSLGSSYFVGAAHGQVAERPADENQPGPGDPRLREALSSPNSAIVSAAAARLTRAHDKASIPLIVEACKRFHDPDEVRQISHTLREFERDPETRAAAQAGEDLCLPPPDPIEALKRNDRDSMLYVDKAATTHPKEAAAILKENFANTQDERYKVQIASALIELGDKEDIYWDFLLRQAVSALESDTSSAGKYDSHGTLIELSPEESWAKQDAMFDTVLLFIETVDKTRDSRGTRLLQRTLSSTNSDFQIFAAAGLARTQNQDSIPLLIEACKNAHRRWRLPLLRGRWSISMILKRRVRWISISPRMPLNSLARRRRGALVR